MTTCSVRGCDNEAAFEAMLYDKYATGEVFEERDHYCPFLCEEHHRENEAGAKGTRTPRDVTDYPFTNRHGAQGFTTYRPL